MPPSRKVTKFHKDLNFSTMILSESLCLGVFVAEKDLSEWAQNHERKTNVYGLTVEPEYKYSTSGTGTYKLVYG
jgi:hypothetical protein